MRPTHPRCHGASFLAVPLLLLSTSVAAGPIASGEYMLKSVQSGLCLDVREQSLANGGRLQQWGCWNGAMNQRFQVTDLGNGAYTLAARHSAKVVDVSGVSAANGAAIWQWDWVGGANQQWEIRAVAGGYELRPRHAPGSCMDVSGYSMTNGAAIHQWSCHGGNNQKWQFLSPDASGGGGGGTPPPPASTTVNGDRFAVRTVGGAASDSSWNIWSNGYIESPFQFTNPATLTVAARGDVAAGAWPRMEVRVGGALVASTTVDSAQWKTYTYAIGNRTGQQSVRISFTNDYAANGQDRNLYIKSATVASGSGSGGGDGGSGGGGGGTQPPGTPVEANGQLRVNGVDLVNQSGQAYQLRGMSSHGLHWFGQFINNDSIKWMRDDWKANVVRAAMYTAEGGYISNPSVKSKVIETVDAAIRNGVYVIIDWHILADNDPNMYKPQAIEFFREMATRYGNRPNVLYEIANEPNGYANWNQHIRPYAVDVIRAIRAIDPDNVIIVGTGTWSQDIHDAANNRLSDANVMYTLHFYAGTHGQYLRDRVDYARSKGAAIFVTEWGTSQASGDGGVYANDTRTWISFLNQRKISWVNWSLCDKNETSAALAGGASPTGGWQDWNLSPSGRLVRELMRAP